MPVETLPIHRLFTADALASLSTTHPNRTPEAFERVVIHHIELFLNEQRKKLNGCAIAIDQEIIELAFGQRGQEFDPALEDALTRCDLELAHKGWVDVDVSSVPRDPSQEELSRFCRFALNAILEKE